VKAAVLTLPPRRTWFQCLLVYVIFVAAAFPLGWFTGFLELTVGHYSTAGLAFLPLYIFLRPALLEELVFRSLLLPRDIQRVSRPRLILFAVVALFLFLISHPIHGWVSKPDSLGLFTNPIFLSLAALLGVACTAAYWISRSIWPPVVIHWSSVLIWIVFLGGQRLVGVK
jgi:predicted Abi (CAAX) family protease